MCKISSNATKNGIKCNYHMKSVRNFEKYINIHIKHHHFHILVEILLTFHENSYSEAFCRLAYSQPTAPTAGQQPAYSQPTALTAGQQPANSAHSRPTASQQRPQPAYS
jgi:hypothetical protein